MSETQFHPLDFDRLTKGDTITQEQCEAATGVKQRDDPLRYELELLGLKGSIEKHRQEFDVCKQGFALHIRTDAETVAKTEWRLAKGRRDATRARQKIAAVEVTKLTEHQQRQAEKLHVASSVRELTLRSQQRNLAKEMRLLEAAPLKKLE